jgi:superfamily II DNA or RNA helicase
MLRELDLLPIYDSSETSIVADLLVPLLRNCKEYYRGVGFFTSGWLRLAAEGLVDLVQNRGIARFIVSPILEEADWRALQLGDAAKQDLRLKSILSRELDQLAVSLDRDTKNCLAWLVADGVLDFRFAIPRDMTSGADYHDKVGVALDDNGDMVAFHGSFNDTFKGSLNGEAFSVFKSWDVGQYPFAEKHRARLVKLWENGNSQFAVRAIPDGIREQFVRLRTSTDRPYNVPAKNLPSRIGITEPHCPVRLRDTQQEAIDSWEAHNCRGILEMATGTGKTYTALAAASRRYKAVGRIGLVILVPYLHLLEQWARDCRVFGFLPILCSGEHAGWKIEAKSALADMKRGTPHVCLLVVHDTASSPAFCELVALMPRDVFMLVADEVHALGASKLRRALVPEARLRLGLSATPRRWFDEEGTAYLMEYFGGVVFEYPLERAIGRDLVPYEYHPILVNLTDSEEREFADITTKVAQFSCQLSRNNNLEEALKMLLIKRARIVGAAGEKLLTLTKILRQEVVASNEPGKEIRDVLIYCAPGTHREVMRAVAEEGIKCHEFVHTVKLREREEVLKHFARGDIQALVAIKCLDEGVDVPTTRTAYFLASTTNPKEFIQRRGRILRLAEGKNKSKVYDFVVVPSDNTPRNVGEAILRRELPRFAEFSSAASNQFAARSAIHNVLDRYEMLNLLDERPWDMYHRLRSNLEGTLL